MKWSDHSWNAIEPIYNKITTMPFIQELANGKLATEKFKYYIGQDALYLEQFGRVLAMIAAKAPNTEIALAFIQFSQNAMVVENTLHASYFLDYNITNNFILQPACHHYTHFLKSIVSFDSIEIAMAAVLPCFWIYKKVGDYLLNLKTVNNNPYQKWINTYGGEDFAISVTKAIRLCDEVADISNKKIKDQMTSVFYRASIMEFEFWDAAYFMKQWSY
ncbi:thiaminase II [Rhizosphaericola mali]|uniref:Aminopyrimidine aminohydrolase n=1 Tax=Rhizosphaericola mali TaxID=2545455 RepID=A0A5P2G0H0_9BACT|nr:thiaminase II [Rhizosphaericola mali]QES88148.1 thiaminase II [Rhizosphaericola mali]